MQTGYRLLREAEAPHRLAADRRRLLDACLEEFIRASAYVHEPTGSTELFVQTELLVATCWLAKGSPADFYTACRGAAARALRDVEIHCQYIRGGHNIISDSERGFRGFRRFLSEFDLTEPTPQERQASAAKIFEAKLSTAQPLIRLFNEVQEVRRAFGEAPASCPRIIGFHYANQRLGLTEVPDVTRFGYELPDWHKLTPALETPGRPPSARDRN